MKIGNFDVQLLVDRHNNDTTGSLSTISAPVTVVNDKGNGQSPSPLIIYHAVPDCCYRIQITALKDTITGKFPYQKFLAFLSIDGIHVGYSKIFDLSQGLEETHDKDNKDTHYNRGRFKDCHIFDGFRKNRHHRVSFKFQETLLWQTMTPFRSSDRDVEYRLPGSRCKDSCRHCLNKRQEKRLLDTSDHLDFNHSRKRVCPIVSKSEHIPRGQAVPISPVVISGVPSMKRRTAPITIRGKAKPLADAVVDEAVTIPDHPSSPVSSLSGPIPTKIQYPFSIDAGNSKGTISCVKKRTGLLETFGVKKDFQTTRDERIADDSKKFHCPSHKEPDCLFHRLDNDVAADTSKENFLADQSKDHRGTIVLTFFEAAPYSVVSPYSSHHHQSLDYLSEEQVIERMTIDEKLWQQPSMTTSIDETSESPLILNRIQWRPKSKKPFETIKVYYHSPEVLDLWRSVIEENLDSQTTLTVFENHGLCDKTSFEVPFTFDEMSLPRISRKVNIVEDIPKTISSKPIQIIDLSCDE